MTDELKRNANLVEALGSTLREGGHAVGTVPGLLKRILVEESWREFVTQRDEHVSHERFADFVVAAPLRGIGATVDLVKRLVAEDVATADLLDQALQNPVGTNVGVSNMNTHRPGGTSKEYALRRLRKDSPDLHTEVITGRMTAHAAMVQAGFSPPVFTVRAGSPEKVAEVLRKKMSPEDLTKLVKLLA